VLQQHQMTELSCDRLFISHGQLADVKGILRCMVMVAGSTTSWEYRKALIHVDGVYVGSELR
jgi:hypothetical protein